MKIRVKLMGALKEKAPPGNTLDLPDDASIESALEALGIAAESVHTVAVNGGFERDRTKTLQPDDELTVLAPMAGG